MFTLILSLVNILLLWLISSNIELILLPDGEDAKSLTELEDIYSKLIKGGCDRSTTFLALGGGVVGDVECVTRTEVQNAPEILMNGSEEVPAVVGGL